MERLIGSFLLYELYLFITALASPAHFSVFSLHYFTPFHCHSSQLTFRSLSKYSYYFAFVLPTPLCQISATLFGGWCYSYCYTYQCRYYDNTILLPWIFHDSWSIFHHPSNNSPWGTHIYPTVKPPQSQHEVQMDLETAQRSDFPSPR